MLKYESINKDEPFSYHDLNVLFEKLSISYGYKNLTFNNLKIQL